MAKYSLYFLDVYVPNEGEAQTALEIGVLHYTGDKRPRVYLHTFLRPVVLNRVRWSNALEQGIRRERIINDPSLPSLNDIIAGNFFKGKEVVCLNPNLEPCRDLLKDARSFGLISAWQQNFADDEEAAKLLRPSQMLDYLKLPVKDESNTRYTPLLCRLHSFIAIYEYLMLCRQNPLYKQPKLGDLHELMTWWPLPSYDLSIFNRSLTSFEELSANEMKTFFSDALPDFLDWQQLSIFGHDWILKRKSSQNLSQLNGKQSMCEYIFQKVLDFKMKLWVLIYYALYDQKTDYALQIALSGGRLKGLPSSIKEDFTLFLIAHLEDFLSLHQKRCIIKAMVHQTLADQDKVPYEDWNFEELKKLNDERQTPMRFIRRGPTNSLKCFREINSDDGIIYREYELSGNDNDRALAAEFINRMFGEFLHEAQVPLSDLWVPKPLQSWIQYVTGFEWADYVRKPRPNEDPELSRSRSFLEELLSAESLEYKRKLRDNLSNVVADINVHLKSKEPLMRSFTFQGISVKVIVKRDRSGMLGRILSF